MRLKYRLLAAASTATLVAGLAVVAAAPAGATTTFNVSADTAQCNTLSGSISFATALKITGPTTGNNTITVKAAVSGCSDTNSPVVGQSSAILMFKGALTSTLHSTGGTNCTGLSGLSTGTTGSSTIVWTPGKAQAFIPTTLVGAAQKPTSTLTINQTFGDQFKVQNDNSVGNPAFEGPWTGVTYGEFELGTAFGTPAGSVVTDFTGPSGTGALSWFAGTTQQDTANVLTQCFTTGLKTVNFGLGALQLG